MWRWDADAFGQGGPDSDPDGDGRKTYIPLRFAGQISSEGGVVYNYFRYYDPKLGRYITSDLIGIDGGLNTYGYANQNPIKYFDPNGETPVTALGGLAAGALGGALGAVVGDAIRGIRGAQLLNSAIKGLVYGGIAGFSAGACGGCLGGLVVGISIDGLLAGGQVGDMVSGGQSGNSCE